MDISDDKMNVYKDLARKCESFELFKWIVGDKESWMTEAGKAETETMLKTIYNGEWDVNMSCTRRSVLFWRELIDT